MAKTGPKPKELVEATIQGLPVGRGENQAVVPPDQVYELAAIGCTDNEISGFFGVKPDTLRRNFAAELSKGREYTKIRLRRAMFRNACDLNNAAVQIFLAKQASILGMTDQIQNNTEEPLPWGDDLTIEEDTVDDTVVTTDE